MQAHEGRRPPAGNQLELWAEPGAPPMLGLRVLRQDGRETVFDVETLSDSIRRAGWPGESLDGDTSLSLARAVRLFLHQSPQPVSIDTVRQTVERLLLEMGYTLTARMYAGAFAPPLDGHAHHTSAVGMLDEALPIDRAGHFLAAAAADAGLERSTADALLAHLLAQIRAAGLQRLTPGLLREWMRSELHARGLVEAAARIARLSLPVNALHDAFTENDRPPSAAPEDPESAALALAGRVSAAYVLGQLLPSAAGQAHLRGDIQVRGIGNFLRLDSAQLSIDDVRTHAGFTRGEASTAPAQLLAAVALQTERLSRFLGGQIAWPATNFGFAPLVQQASQDELTAVVRALVSGNTPRGDSTAGRAAVQYGIAWDAPERQTEFENVDGERLPIDTLYPAARSFFATALSVLAELSEHGWPIPSAGVAIHLSPYFFGAPESEQLLELIGRIAFGNLSIELRYDCPMPHLFDALMEGAEQSAIAQTVMVPVARAAQASTDLEDFVARVETRLEAAVAAHRAKRDFLLRVFAERSGPLSSLRTRYGEGPLANPTKMHYRIALEDASVATLERADAPWMAPGDALNVAEVALHHLRDSCVRWGVATGLQLKLTDADAVKPIGRARDRGASRHISRPLDTLAIESRLHEFYDEPAIFTVSPESFSTAHEAADFIRRAFLHTPCRALRFV
jgi:hypothetical protein